MVFPLILVIQKITNNIQYCLGTTEHRQEKVDHQGCQSCTPLRLLPELHAITTLSELQAI